jgi:RNA polymerase sigma factor (TIGR02999 family)
MHQPAITELLEAARVGQRDAFDLLLARVYPDLRQIAHARLRDQRSGHTLNTTALVHEAYLKLVPYQDVDWKGRAHFFGAVATTMRRILVDHARARNARKREGERVSLDGMEHRVGEVDPDNILEIDDALVRLAAERPRWVQVVECRYFAGMTIEETAEVLGISHGTVSNDWQMARAWLRRELQG